MARIAIIVGALIVLLLGAAAILPQLIPSDVYRTRIETAASEALGRDVKVGGDIKVAIFPRIEARAGATTVANPAGFGDAPFASMKEMRAAVKLIPLIFQKVEVEEFVLVEPTIALVKLESGADNWTFDIAKNPDKPKKDGGGSIGAALGDVRIVNGRVSYDDRAAKQIHTLAKLNLKADMKVIDQPFSIKADGTADDLPFNISAKIGNPKALMNKAASPLEVELTTDILTTNLTGTLAMGDTPAFDFTFEGAVPSVPAVADAFKLKNLPARAVLGRVSASGQALGTPDDITLKIKDARHESPLLNADFNGDIRITQAISLALTVNADAPKLAELAKAMAIEAPAGAALGAARATTKVSGTLGDLTFSDINFTHDSTLLAITFTGGAKLAKALTYGGRLSIMAPDLKQLAKAAGAALPEGNIYRSFALTGNTSGSATDLMLTNATVEFDDIKGTGEAALDFSSKPKLVGSLTTGLIDATPYATASGAPTEKKESGGWGDQPIDLSPLKLADADLTVRAAGIKFQAFDFGPSNVVMKLVSGRLTADLQQTSLFGGKGGAMIVADATTTTPTVALKANIKGLALKPLLIAAAGFDMLDGNGDLDISITGTGGTLQTLMASLAGSGKLDVGNGVLQGIDLPALGKAAQTALTTRSIPLAAFGTNAKTNFGGLDASFSMQDGIAAMGDLKLNANEVTVSGAGTLDIGKQKLSLSLFPEYKDKSQGAQGYGLPVKLAGGWSGVNMTLDYDWLIQRATADAKAKVSTEIEKELRKQLGGDLGKFLGGGQPSAAPSPAPASGGDPATPSPSPSPAASPTPTPEDQIKKEAGKALGKLFGNN